MPFFAQAKCYSIYSPSGELVYSSDVLPFPFPEQFDAFSDSVNKIIPGGHLIISDDEKSRHKPCLHLDKVTLKAKEELKKIEEEILKAHKTTTEIQNKQQKEVDELVLRIKNAEKIRLEAEAMREAEENKFKMEEAIRKAEENQRKAEENWLMQEEAMRKEKENRLMQEEAMRKAEESRLIEEENRHREEGRARIFSKITLVLGIAGVIGVITFCIRRWKQGWVGLNTGTKIKLSIASAFVIFSTWFYFAPYLAVSGMKSAAEAKDAVKLSDYVNFPALKESLKASFNAKLTSDVVKEKDGNPFAALGATLAAAFINQMIDAFVTPESLAMMMRGDKPQSAKNIEKTKFLDSNVDTSMTYESFDRFVVTVKKKGTTEEPLGLVFNRDGMFSWKLSAVRLSI